MKKLFTILTLIIALFACKNVDTRKELHSDKENIVQLGDTLVIFTGSCKGCEFSATYSFSDSLGIIKESGYKRIDSCPECDGGSYTIELEFVPLKAGKTVLKMYQHEWARSVSIDASEPSNNQTIPVVVDSVLVATFKIEVKE